VCGFVYFALMNTANPGRVFLPIMLSLIVHDMMWGPQGAFIVECVTPIAAVQRLLARVPFRLDRCGPAEQFSTFIYPAT
jgi:hypothetical protein